MSTEPTEAEVEVALREILECWDGNRRHDKTMAYVVVGAVLPLYRDRLLRELADEADADLDVDAKHCGHVGRWLRARADRLDGAK